MLPNAGVLLTSLTERQELGECGQQPGLGKIFPDTDSISQPLPPHAHMPHALVPEVPPWHVAATEESARLSLGDNISHLPPKYLSPDSF